MSEGRMTAEQTPDIETVLAEHLGECRRFGLPCADVQPRNEWCTRCALRAKIMADLAPVLAAAVREAKQRAWDEDTLTSALMDAVFVPGPIRINKDGALVLTHDEARSAARRLLRDRADRIAVDAPEGGEGR